MHIEKKTATSPQDFPAPCSLNQPSGLSDIYLLFGFGAFERENFRQQGLAGLTPLFWLLMIRPFSPEGRYVDELYYYTHRNKVEAG